MILFAGLRRRWQRIALITLAGTIIALAISLLLPNRYDSTVRLMPPTAEPLSTAMSGALAQAVPAASSLAGGLLNDKTPTGMFMGVLTSRTMQDALIDRFDLRRVYGVSTYAAARKDLAKNTDLEEDKRGFLTIRVTDRDARRAQAMARAYVDELNYLVASANTTSAHRERAFLEVRLKTVRQDLDNAERQLGSFSSHNAAFDMTTQSKALLDELAVLQGQMIAAESDLNSLRQSYTSDSAPVKLAQAKITALQSHIRALGGTAKPEPVTDAISPSLRQLPLLGVTYYDLYRRVATEETVYESLTRQYESAKVQEARDTPSVSVLDSADIPEGKSFPPRLMIVTVGMIISFFAAICWAIADSTWHHMRLDHPLRLAFREILHS